MSAMARGRDRSYVVPSDAYVRHILRPCLVGKMRQNEKFLDIIAFSFVCSKYCLIMIGSKDLSRDLQTNS